MWLTPHVLGGNLAEAEIASDSWGRNEQEKNPKTSLVSGSY